MRELQESKVLGMKFGSYSKLSIVYGASVGVVAGFLFFVFSLFGFNVVVYWNDTELRGILAGLVSLILVPLGCIAGGLFISTLGYLPFRLGLKIVKGIHLKGRFQVPDDAPVPAQGSQGDLAHGGEKEEWQRSLADFREWVPFVGSLRDLPESVWASSLEEGKWSIKEIVCHIMLWDQYFYEEAIRNIVHKQRLTLKHLNYDEFNNGARSLAKTISVEELLGKAVEYRERILQALQSLNEEELSLVYPDGEGKAFFLPQYVKDFIWHDQHHMKPLQEYLDGRDGTEGAESRR